MVLSAIPCSFFPRLSTKHSFVRVMATGLFRRSSSISGLGLPFFINFYGLMEIDRRCVLCVVAGRNRAVTFTPVAGRVQVGRDFAFEA
jgi:hypothetical protein